MIRPLFSVSIVKEILGSEELRNSWKAETESLLMMTKMSSTYSRRPNLPLLPSTISHNRTNSVGYRHGTAIDFNTCTDTINPVVYKIVV